MRRLQLLADAQSLHRHPIRPRRRVHTVVAGDEQRLATAHRQRAHVVIGMRGRRGDHTAISFRDRRAGYFLDHLCPASGVQLLEVHPHLAAARHPPRMLGHPALRSQQRDFEDVPAGACIEQAHRVAVPGGGIDLGGPIFAACLILCQRSSYP